jgi:hypothetical protein
MRNVGLCALAIIGLVLLGLTILLGIRHPAEVLAVTTAILAAATLVLAVVAVAQRSRRDKRDQDATGHSSET